MNQISYHEDLNAIQRDMLVAIARIDQRDDSTTGAAVRDELERNYDEISSSRLYKNLDRLEQLGLIQRERLDARSKRTELTDEGRGLLADHVQSVAGALGCEVQHPSTRVVGR